MERGKKYIHYCWFGGQKLPRKARKCIRSWKKYLPEYEIVRWDESNSDLEACPFIKEAYEKKKWAFVADYVRSKAIYEYGGIYFDTDMMIKKDVKFLLDKPAFLGVEDSRYVNAAVWGALEPKSFLAGEVVKFYESQAHFNSRDLYAITIPVIITRILEKYGFDRNSDEIQVVKGTYIYPREYFYPLSYDHENNVFTKNTCMVHYADATWTSKTEKRDIKLIRIFGRKGAGIILKVLRSVKAMLVYYGKVLWRTITLILFPVRKIVKMVRGRNRISYVEAVKKINKTKASYLAFTHEDWIGVESSTRELFGDVVVIPDFEITSNLAEMAEAVAKNKNIKLVIFSAFGEGWEYFVQKIREARPDIKMKVFWHGSNAMHGEKFDWDRFKAVFRLLEQRTIDSVAFAKKSMYEQYKKLGYNVEFLPNDVNFEFDKKEILAKRVAHDDTRIGIYASGERWVKNIYNQMAAASLIDNATLDMVPLSDNSVEFAKILKMDVTGEEKSVTRKALFERIANDDIVLYATFVECAPILPLECLELGVLCITGDNHHYFTDTPLEKYLVEPKVDNPMAIAARIEKCLKNKDEILKLYKEWKKDYDKYCKKELKKFLEV